MERTLAVTAASGPVLGYLTDFGNTAAWDPAVQRSTRQDSGPIRPGASWLQVCKILGITTEMVYTLVSAEAGRLLFHGRNEGATCTDSVAVRPLAAGAEVTYRVELEMHGLAKLATPLMRVEFEKFGTASAVALTSALNGLAAMRTTEVQFPPPATLPSTVLGELPG
ncbi:SRPBCC family protein [Paractinoplanes deccanensis]|uniref:SRPBCC family protein n=1 Tax=Paractinoplanes deccanensis TaxID=113561 RepID=UPI0019454B5B|nr:SRPBCC family protein [Actinoplanes deccanensis]